MEQNPAKNMTLYWGSGSGPCWRAMMALEEKDLKGYNSKLIEFSKKGHKTEEVLKLNPRGQVPTFKDGDTVVNESLAICFYLESRYKGRGNRLVPDDICGGVLQKVFESNNVQKAVMEELGYYLYRTKEEDRKKEDLDEKVQKAKDELARWEKFLKERHDAGKKFLVGDQFTLADICFFQQVAVFHRFGLNLDKAEYENLKKYYDDLKDRPSVQASWPPHYKTDPATQTGLNCL